MDIQSRLRAEAIANAHAWLADPRTIILDTETTGLNGFLVEIAIINVAGEVLMNTLVNPQHPIHPKARAVHGHTLESLANSPTFDQVADDLLTHLIGRNVVIYNANFDTQILFNELYRWLSNLEMPDVRRETTQLLARATYSCAMLAYSDYIGDWNDYHGNNRWQRLPGGDHTALGDCRATLEVLKRMAAENKA